MKTTLSILVLLFSFSVVAGDNLEGRSIICGKIDKKNEILNIRGWEFLSDQDIKYYFYSNDEEKIKIGNYTLNRDYYYQTTYSKITIKYSALILDSKRRYVHTNIDRKTLDVYYKRSVYDDEFIKQFSGEDCSVIVNEPIYNHIKQILEKLLNEVKEMKKDNLI